MSLSVQKICKLLVSSKLLQPEQVQAVHSRWVVDAGLAAGDS